MKLYMRNFGLAIALCVSFANSASAKTEYPFIGVKNFSFGGVPAYHETYTLSIRKSGQTRLTMTTCYSLGCDKTKLLYKGRFKPLIRYTDGYNSFYLWLNKNAVRLLDSKKKQMYDCDAANANYGPCVSQYY